MRTPKPIQDRRRSVRVVEKLSFSIGHESFEIQASTVNIGSHGALCFVNQDIPMMSQLHIGLAIPKTAKVGGAKKILRIKGVVVRKDKDPKSNGYFLAVFFSEIKPADQKILDAYIHRHLNA